MRLFRLLLATILCFGWCSCDKETDDTYVEKEAIPNTFDRHSYDSFINNEAHSFECVVLVNDNWQIGGLYAGVIGKNYCYTSDKDVFFANYYKNEGNHWEGYYPQDSIILNKQEYIDTLEFGSIKDHPYTIVRLKGKWFDIRRTDDRVLISIDKNETGLGRGLYIHIATTGYGVASPSLEIEQSATSEVDFYLTTK